MEFGFGEDDAGYTPTFDALVIAQVDRLWFIWSLEEFDLLLLDDTPTFDALTSCSVDQLRCFWFLVSVICLEDLVRGYRRTRGFNFPSQWFINAPRFFGFIRRSRAPIN